jgi:hypothetical protein
MVFGFRPESRSPSTGFPTRTQNVTRAELVRGALAMLAGVEIKPGNGHSGNRDGKDDAARTLIKYNMARSVKALVKLLEGHGIKRGKNWVSDARMKQREAGTTLHD